MFDDSSSKNVGFQSVWKNERSTVSVGTETAFEAAFKEGSSQTSSLHHKQVQASQEVFSPNQASYNEDNLIAFMRRAGKAVLEALDEEDPSLKCLSEPIIEEADRNFEQICSLRGSNAILVSSISWSCDEKQIAVGYRTHHDNWCHHSGIIDLFKYEEPSCQESASNKPSETLSLKNCVSAVSFHPTDRSVLAAGTVNGDVYIWSIKRSITKSEIFSTHHTDCITQISWVSNPTDSKLMLASASKDSFLILWDVSVSLNTIKPKHRFFFENESYPGVEPGVNCFSFAPMQPDCFVAALMNGKLLKCSVVAARPLPQAKGRKFPAQNAVIDVFKNHPSSPIISLDFQNSKKNLFLAVTADDKCFIYSLAEVEPLRVLVSDQNLIGAKWYRPDPSYFMTWGESTATFCNSDLESFRLPFEPFQHKDNTALVSTVCFNPEMPNRAAFGSSDGNTVLWKIPTRISKDE